MLSGGRRVAVRGRILGLAYGDRDLLEPLRRAGVPDPEQAVDDPVWVEWRGGRAHEWGAT
jgi:hypothetical protein